MGKLIVCDNCGKEIGRRLYSFELNSIERNSGQEDNFIKIELCQDCFINTLGTVDFYQLLLCGNEDR